MPLRFLAIRAFTPIGAVLAIWRPAGRAAGIGLWRAWALLALATLAMLATKLHHEYYLLILVPAAAAGVGPGARPAGRRPARADRGEWPPPAC